MTTPYLSIVIPCWNEAERLPATLRDLESFFSKLPLEWECILAIEKSQDSTLVLAQEAARALSKFKVLDLKVHRGKGFAIREGLQRATGTFVFTMDADLSVPLSEVIQYIHNIEALNADILVADRFHRESKIYELFPVWRNRFESQFQSQLRELLEISFDTQCGFKMIRQQALVKILPHLQCDGFICETEMVLVSQELGLAVAAQPIQWRARGGSHFSRWLDRPRLLLDLWRLPRRRNQLRSKSQHDSKLFPKP